MNKKGTIIVQINRETLRWKTRLHAPHASVMGKRDVGSDAPAKVSLLSFYVERRACLRWKTSSPSTRRWLDRRNPRDAGEWDACQTISFFVVNIEFWDHQPHYGRWLSFAQTGRMEMNNGKVSILGTEYKVTEGAGLGVTELDGQCMN